MVVSDARREANRRNAQKSTGPVTDSGKDRSRENAWKHGLTAATVEEGGIVKPDQIRERAERVRALRGQFQPRGDWESWLVEQMAGVTLRLSRIAVLEAQGRAVAAWRAEDLWEEDRRAEVEQVGAKLAKAPGRVVTRLRQSPQGCDWLIERWAALAGVAEQPDFQTWDEEQTRLAWDLLGVPESCRAGAVGRVIDAEGRVGAAPGPADLARREIADLCSLRERAGEADEVNRTLVEGGMSDVPSREVANLRRYERTALRHLGWLSAQMKEAGLQGQGGSNPQPRSPAAEPPTGRENAAMTARPTPPTPREPIPDRNPVEVSAERTVRNESISPRKGDETNPFWDRPGGQVASKPGADEPRKRPDLAKLTRREQDRRSNRIKRSSDPVLWQPERLAHA